MAPLIQRLGPGDEAILKLLATDDADFDVDGRGSELAPLSADAARRFLANPAVLFWVAVEDDTIAGFLYCLLVPMRSGDEHELLLYEIGVRSAWRRLGVGHALLDAMEHWMREHGVAEVWLGADNPGAIAFYRALGFVADEGRPVFMSRRLDAPDM